MQLVHAGGGGSGLVHLFILLAGGGAGEEGISGGRLWFRLEMAVEETEIQKLMLKMELLILAVAAVGAGYTSSHL